MPTFVTTLAPFDTVSGSIGKRKSNPSRKAFISNLRKAGMSATLNGAPFMFLSLRQNDRSTALSAKESAWRETFAEVVVAVDARMKDPVHIAADQAAFKAQSKYKTLRQYLFSVVRETIEA